MAQAQIQVEMEDTVEQVKTCKPRNKSKTLIQNSFRSSCKSKKASFHSIPLMIRIQSKPVPEGVTTRILLDDDWMVFMGGDEGQVGGKSHINIRKLNFNPGDADAGEGISLPKCMLPCLQEALNQLSKKH